MDEDLAKLHTFLKRQAEFPPEPLAQQRARFDRADEAMPLPEGLTAATWSHGALRGQWLKRKTAPSKRALLYLHGGGYRQGSSRSHRHLAGAICDAASCDALVLDYRLAPEHPFPAALEDAIAAYKALLETYEPSQLAVAGDSAGGGLSVAMLLSIRDLGLPMPSSLALLSPWADLSMPELTVADRERAREDIVHHEAMPSYIADYLGERPAKNPLVSPVYGSLHGFPPMLIQVGAQEVILRDSLALARAVRDSPVTVEIVPDVPHVWQWFWPRLRVARDSIQRIGRFMDAHIT